MDAHEEKDTTPKSVNAGYARLGERSQIQLTAAMTNQALERDAAKTRYAQFCR